MFRYKLCFFFFLRTVKVLYITFLALLRAIIERSDDGESTGRHGLSPIETIFESGGNSVINQLLNMRNDSFQIGIPKFF